MSSGYADDVSSTPQQLHFSTAPPVAPLRLPRTGGAAMWAPRDGGRRVWDRSPSPAVSEVSRRSRTPQVPSSVLDEVRADLYSIVSDQGARRGDVDSKLLDVCERMSHFSVRSGSCGATSAWQPRSRSGDDGHLSSDESSERTDDAVYLDHVQSSDAGRLLQQVHELTVELTRLRENQRDLRVRYDRERIDSTRKWDTERRSYERSCSELKRELTKAQDALQRERTACSERHAALEKAESAAEVHARKAEEEAAEAAAARSALEGAERQEVALRASLGLAEAQLHELRAKLHIPQGRYPASPPVRRAPPAAVPTGEGFRAAGGVREVAEAILAVSREEAAARQDLRQRERSLRQRAADMRRRVGAARRTAAASAAPRQQPQPLPTSPKHRPLRPSQIPELMSPEAAAAHERRQVAAAPRNPSPRADRRNPSPRADRRNSSPRADRRRPSPRAEAPAPAPAPATPVQVREWAVPDGGFARAWGKGARRDEQRPRHLAAGMVDARALRALREASPVSPPQRLPSPPAPRRGSGSVGSVRRPLRVPPPPEQPAARASVRSVSAPVPAAALHDNAAMRRTSPVKPRWR